MKSLKYSFMFLTYLWLRFDLVLRLAFRNNWTPRYEFFAAIFGEADATEFLQKRVALVKARNQVRPPIIPPSKVEKTVNLFLKTDPKTSAGRNQRVQIIDQLIFWATDQTINEYNIDSYQTRSTIIDSLLNQIFQNALSPESEQILAGLKKIVFSRTTYLGSKGEPSPIVHDVIISGVGRLLSRHFNEVLRQRDEKLDKLTKIKLIKEIKQADKDSGSLAFSGTTQQNDDYKHQFPLEKKYADLLLKILDHYRYSAWPESRQRAIDLIASMEKQLGFSLAEL